MESIGGIMVKTSNANPRAWAMPTYLGMIKPQFPHPALSLAVIGMATASTFHLGKSNPAATLDFLAFIQENLELKRFYDFNSQIELRKSRIIIQLVQSGHGW